MFRSIRSGARRRHRTTAVLVAGAVVIAAGCGGGTGSESTADQFVETPEEVVLTMWTWAGTGHELLIEEFELEHPGVRVDVRTSSFDQHHAGLLEAFDAEIAVPDVAAVERDYLPTFAADEANFVDLRTFGAADVESEYLPWRWFEGTASSGAVLGVPTDVGGLAIAYRADLFEAAGLPSDPAEVALLFESWDGFLETGRAFRDAGLDAHFVDSVDSVFSTRLGQEPVGYVTADGESALDGDGLASTWDLSMTAVADDLDAGLNQFSPEWNDAMVAGDFAVLAAPSWMRGYIAGVAPDTVGLWRAVPVPGGVGNWGGSQLTVPAESDHPELAWELVRHLTDQDAQLELFRRNGNFPSTPALYEHPEIMALQDPLFGGQNVGQLYASSVVGVPGQPTSPRQREVRGVFLDVLSKVSAGKVTVDEAWPLASERAVAIVDAGLTTDDPD